MVKKTDKTPFKMSDSVGISGFKRAGNHVYDEYLTQLRGRMGRLKYREMADTDPIIGAMLYAITSIIRAAVWDVEPSEMDTEEKYSEWVEENVFKLDSLTWDQVVEDALTMLIYGFSVQEIITKTKDDGTIGLAELFPLSQETILKWDFDKSGRLLGLWQTPPMGGSDIYLPIEKIVLYRTCFNRGNPEGRSLLRNCFQSYHHCQTVTISETIGIERDLTGLPVLKAPAAWLGIGSNRAIAEMIVRDIRLNDQSGIVLDSDMFQGKDGGLSNAPKFSFELLSAQGSGKVDTDKVIRRHQANIARTLLADFILLGSDGKGSYSLSENKSDIFIRAVEGMVENLCQTIDRQVLPILWKLNRFPEEMKPSIKLGSLAPIDLATLGDFVAKISGAGILLNDERTENYLRSAAGLPPVEKEDPAEPIEDPEAMNGNEGEEDQTTNDLENE